MEACDIAIRSSRAVSYRSSTVNNRRYISICILTGALTGVGDVRGNELRGALQGLEPGQWADINLAVGGCFGHWYADFTFSRTTDGKMWVDIATNHPKNSTGRHKGFVPDVDVIAVDQELEYAQADHKRHCTSHSTYRVAVHGRSRSVTRYFLVDSTCAGPAALAKLSTF